jgi:hypothetical protein
MISTPRSMCGRVLLTTATLLALALPAASATLVITGTPGAQVTLDGQVVGTLPLDGPLTVPLGRHDIAADLPGMLPIAREIIAESELHEFRLHLRMTPMSRTSAVTRSLMLAGSGQRYEGRTRMGWVLTGVEVGGLLTALLSDLMAQNHKDDYLLARDDYNNAFVADDLDYYRALMDDKYDAMTGALDRRNIALAAAAGAVIVSVLDAWLRFPSAEMGTGPRPVPPADRYSLGGSHPTDRRGFHLGWRLSF